MTLDGLEDYAKRIKGKIVLIVQEENYWVRIQQGQREAVGLSKQSLAQALNNATAEFELMGGQVDGS